MVLSDLSIKRPVICLVASILILLVGALAFKRLRRSSSARRRTARR